MPRRICCAAFFREYPDSRRSPDLRHLPPLTRTGSEGAGRWHHIHHPAPHWLTSLALSCYHRYPGYSEFLSVAIIDIPDIANSQRGWYEVPRQAAEIGIARQQSQSLKAPDRSENLFCRGKTDESLDFSIRWRYPQFLSEGNPVGRKQCTGESGHLCG